MNESKYKMESKRIRNEIWNELGTEFDTNKTRTNIILIYTLCFSREAPNCFKMEAGVK